MRVFAILLFAAAAHAAIIKRDVSVNPVETVKFVEIPENTPAQDKDNDSEKDPLAPQTPVGQVGNDLRAASELHIPVAIVQDTQYVVKTATDNEVTQAIDKEIIKDEEKIKDDEIIKDEEDEAQTPKPGFIQQGIQNLQALQQAASLSITNALQSDTPQSSSGSNVFEQSVASLQNAFNSGIDAIMNTINKYGQPATQSNEQSSNQNLLANIQQNLQNNFNRLNQTIREIIHPAPGSTTTVTADDKNKITQIEANLENLNQGFQIGLKNAAEGLSAISTYRGEETKQSSNTTTVASGATGGSSGLFPSNPFPAFTTFLNNWNQTISNAFNSFTNSFNNLTNSTNNQQSEEGTGNTNPFFQTINNFQQAWQNFIPGSGNQSQSSGSNPINNFNPFQQTWQFVNNIFQNNQNPNVQTPDNSTKSAVDEKVPVSGDNGRKKGHGGGGSGDNNDVDSSSAGIGLKSDPVKAPESSEAPAADPAEAPEKSEEAAKPVETEKFVDA